MLKNPPLSALKNKIKCNKALARLLYRFPVYTIKDGFYLFVETDELIAEIERLKQGDKEGFLYAEKIEI